VSRFVIRTIGYRAAALGAFSILALTGGGPLVPLFEAPAAAQFRSEGSQFLKAVEDRDGDTATELLNQPGTQVANARDITSGETGLHIVAQRRDVLWIRFLLQRGADPNIEDRNGTYPIQIATRLGDVDSVEELIKGGAQVNVSDSQGETPLISAVHQRNPTLIARLLKQGANPDRSDNSGRTARDYAKLLPSNSQIMDEFAAADEERENKGTSRAYGPSF